MANVYSALPLINSPHLLATMNVFQQTVIFSRSSEMQLEVILTGNSIATGVL